jgi:hypothetical protein
MFIFKNSKARYLSLFIVILFQFAVYYGYIGIFFKERFIYLFTFNWLFIGFLSINMKQALNNLVILTVVPGALIIVVVSIVRNIVMYDILIIFSQIKFSFLAGVAILFIILPFFGVGFLLRIILMKIKK